ncbi:MAG TPA: right-handed parallel beta-helix repeat-containing protein, partial [bacterium]|nr:right-handed parallel beta-helix repeat-containing protein [bacterium]
MKYRVSFLMLLGWITPAVFAAEIHIPADYSTIQAGIDAAVSGDTVIIADGTYTGAGNRNLDPGGKAITIQSENGPDACIIDCESAGRGFVIQTGETSSTVIEGLTVRDGHSSAEGGGAMITNSSAPVFRDCAFLSCTTSLAGGGVYVQNSDPEFRDCRFLNNHSGDDGGGLFLEGTCLVEITECHFQNNTGGTGAGACVYGNTVVTFTSCTLLENTGNNGGGIACREYANATVIDCTVYNNEAAFDGGGICTELNASLAVKNSSIGENTAGNEGGGFFLSGDGNVSIYGATVMNNSARYGGAVSCLFNASPDIDACIIQGNIATYGGGGVSVNNAAAQISDCEFRQNSALKGGGLTSMVSTGAVTGCLFIENSAVEEGGAIFCAESTGLVFGGSPENANQFSGNLAGFGADLFAKIIPETPINATDNSFQGCPEAEYFVAPAAAFDVTGCQAGFTPLTQDVYVATTGNDGNNGLTPDTPFKTIRHALSRIRASEANPITVHLAPGSYSFAATGETFPVPLLSHVHVTAQPDASSGATATLAGSEEFQLLRARHTAGAKLSHVTLSEGRAGDGGALYSKDSSWILNSVTLRSNEADQHGEHDHQAEGHPPASLDHLERTPDGVPDIRAFKGMQ